MLDRGLLIAQTNHGPGMHGGVVVMVLVAIAVVGGLVYLVKRRRRSDRDGASDRDPASDRSPEA